MTDVDPSPIFILGTNTTRDVRAKWGHRGVNLYLKNRFFRVHIFYVNPWAPLNLSPSVVSTDNMRLLYLLLVI